MYGGREGGGGGNFTYNKYTVGAQDLYKYLIFLVPKTVTYCNLLIPLYI